jgi:putative drug exporter of the RND superfamily
VPSAASSLQTPPRSRRTGGRRSSSASRCSRTPRSCSGTRTGSAATQTRVVRRAQAIADREYPELLSIPFALPVTNALGLFPGAAESDTTAITFLYFEPGVGLNARVRLANWFMDIRVDHPEDALVGKTGIVPARAAQSRVIRDALPRVQIGTILLIALVIGLTFRGVAAPLVMLAAVGISYAVALRLIAFAAQTAGVTAPQESEPVMLVLLLGS